MAACGKKGVGKSYQHMKMLIGCSRGDPYAGIAPRKCLIMDVNDEYGTFNVPSISLADVSRFSVAKIKSVAEIRRVRPYMPNGMRMTLDQWMEALMYVLQRFVNGILLIEDFNKFIGDHVRSDFVGAICTNRHAGLDILLSYQSLGRINTRIWGNLNMLRFHKNTESVERHHDKFPDKYAIMRIAEIMVDNKYLDGDIHFFVYVDMDEQKIRGEEELPDDFIEQSINQFLDENPKTYKALTRSQDSKGRKRNEQTAKNEMKERLKKMYFQ